MRRCQGALALLAIPLAAGCARTSVTTEVKSDGTWTRSLKFVGQPTPEKGQGSMGPPPLRDVFVLPEGQGWKSSIKKADNEVTYTAEHSFAKGETFQNDVIVKGKVKTETTRVLTNEVTVREVAPGRLEYREVLHWKGERPKEIDSGLPEMARALKTVLPANLATEEEAKALAQVTLREFWRMLFGPGDPLLSQMITHPDLLEKRFKQRVGRVLQAALIQKFGDRLTPEQRAETVRKLWAMTSDKNSTFGASTKSATAGPGGGDNDMSSMTPLLFTVHLPGRIVSHNGELDESANEVFWALYSEAAALDDVVMTATCEIPKAAASR